MKNITTQMALLIDADNAPAEAIETIIENTSLYGSISIRRIYGNWADNRLAKWKAIIHKYSLKPIQVFDAIKGKNATDIVLIIDAMDIMHSHKVNGFCIVSGDSDYSTIAQRIREEGLFILGMGDANKTSSAFVEACNQFVYTNTAKQEAKKPIAKVATPKAKPTKVVAAKPVENPLPINKMTQKPLDLNLVYNACAKVAKENGLVHLGELGKEIRLVDPTFNCKSYGSATMSSLFKKLPKHFELVNGGANDPSMYLKVKKK